MRRIQGARSLINVGHFPNVVSNIVTLHYVKKRRQTDHGSMRRRSHLGPAEVIAGVVMIGFSQMHFAEMLKCFRPFTERKRQVDAGFSAPARSSWRKKRGHLSNQLLTPDNRNWPNNFCSNPSTLVSSSQLQCVCSSSDNLIHNFNVIGGN